MFHACYLLVSINPSYTNHTYIGYTVDPRRRLKQHNGEIAGGARKTSRKQPWEMVAVVYGFPSEVVALTWEWAWQNPTKSKLLKNDVSVSGVGSKFLLRAKIRYMCEMLHLPKFTRLPLCVLWLAPHRTHEHLEGCPPFPLHVHASNGPVDSLPCYRDPEYEVDMRMVQREALGQPPRSPHKCSLCSFDITPSECVSCPLSECSMSAHITCLATLMLQREGSDCLLPTSGKCPDCHQTVTWGNCVEPLRAYSAALHNMSVSQ